MCDLTKAIVLQTAMLVLGVVLTMQSAFFFRSRGMGMVGIIVPSFLLLAPFGLYILFGKYVCISGMPVPRKWRLIVGLGSILIVPVTVLFLLWP